MVNDPVQPHSGGSTLLWQHLFWFFGHPEICGASCRRWESFRTFSSPACGEQLLELPGDHRAACWRLPYSATWCTGHHMFVSGMNPFSSLVFSFPTLIITIPATIIVLIWIGSLYGSHLRINTASLFALGFISMFVDWRSVWILPGAAQSATSMLHGTYFVVGHFHLVMAVAAIFGIFCGAYFWFPKMFGHMMNKKPSGKFHFLLTFIGAYCIFMPFHYLGLAAQHSALPILLGIHGAFHSGAPVHHDCRSPHGSSAADFLVQFDLQPVLG